MLAAALEESDLAGLCYPLIASPKIDGIRCITTDPILREDACLPVTRALKKVPNLHVRKMLAQLPPGLDGELTVPGQTFSEITSSIMREHGEPRFQYWVFDYLPMWSDPRRHDAVCTGYLKRLDMLTKVLTAMDDRPEWLRVLQTYEISSLGELLVYEQDMLAEGHEGICLRAPSGAYKFGRSSMREGWLMKLKRFRDAEAEVVGYEELVRNENAPVLNELGYQARRSCRADMRPGGMLGALVLRRPDGVEFRCGTGLAENHRIELWDVRDTLIGRIVKYRYQEHGSKDRPRIPVFLAFRDRKDLDPGHDGTSGPQHVLE